MINNFFLFNSKNPIPFKYSENAIISFKSINSNFIKVNITTKNDEESYSVNNKFMFLYLEKDEEILIKTSGPTIFYLIKEINFACHDNEYKYMKVVIPYVKENYNFINIM